MIVPHKEKIRRIREALVKEGKIRIEDGEVVSLVPRIGTRKSREGVEEELREGEIGIVGNGQGKEFKELDGMWWPKEWEDEVVRRVSKLAEVGREFSIVWEGSDGSLNEMIGKIEKVTKERKLLVLKDSRWRGVWKSAMRVKYLDVELGKIVELWSVEGEKVWCREK